MSTQAKRSDPRIERTKTVVLDAVVDLLAERGFGRVTIEAVSERTGVARSTVYRHWRTLNELLLEAMHSLVQHQTIPDTGSIREDLIDIYEQLAWALNSPKNSACIASLLAEAKRDPELAALHQGFSMGRRERVTLILARAVERGELQERTNLDQVAEDITAPIFMRGLILQEPVSHEVVAHAVDRALRDVWVSNPE